VWVPYLVAERQDGSTWVLSPLEMKTVVLPLQIRERQQEREERCTLERERSATSYSSTDNQSWTRAMRLLVPERKTCVEEGQVGSKG